MFVLQIEHEVLDYVSWKKSFDGDPKGRTELGVSQYEVFCLTNNPNFVIVNFWFEDINQAENSLAFLRNLWDTDSGSHKESPTIRIFDMIDWDFMDKPGHKLN